MIVFQVARRGGSRGRHPGQLLANIFVGAAIGAVGAGLLWLLLLRDLGHGHVYRIAPDPDEPDLLPPATEADILAQDLTLSELTRRLAGGGRIVTRTVDRADGVAADQTPLFVVDGRGNLRGAAEGASHSRKWATS